MAESSGQETKAQFTIGIVLFDRAEELDWVGPFEVFTMAREVANGEGPAANIRVVLISHDGAVVQGAKGMRVEVDHSFADAPSLDLLLIPGGIGTRDELMNDVMLNFLRKKATECEWLTSVCTGSLLLHAAAAPCHAARRDAQRRSPQPRRRAARTRRPVRAPYTMHA